MQSYLRIIALALGLAVALGIVLFAFGEGGTRYQLVRIGNETFALELAETEAGRTRGLRGRGSVAPDGGMLIRIERAKTLAYSTRYTPFPLDVIYLGAEGEVVQVDHLHANDDRLTASTSRDPVYGVILLLGGTARRLHLAPGDRIEFGRPPRRRSDFE